MNKNDVKTIQEALLAFRNAVFETGYSLSEAWNNCEWEAVEATLDVYSTNNTSTPHYPFAISFDEQLDEIIDWCDAVIEDCEEILSE